MTYKLICDSCTDLPQEILSDVHVEKIPLSLQIGGETIPDDDSIAQDVLLDKIRQCKEALHTACPSPAQYMDAFDMEGDNYVVTLSANLSGSHNAATQAASIYREEGGTGNVHVFNSRSASAGQVLVALKIRELAEAGTPFDQVVEKIETFIGRMQTLFVLDNLDTLRKNGRMTKVQSLVSGAFRVKLLMGGTREGEIEKLGQGLSMKQTLVRMASRMAEDADHEGRTLVVAQCNCPERAEEFCALVRERCKFKDIVVVPAGGVSTLYANDGGIITAY